MRKRTKPSNEKSVSPKQKTDNSCTGLKASIGTAPHDRGAFIRDLSSLYDLYRTTAQNERYYAAKLKTFRAWGLYLDIAPAVLAPSCLGSWAFFKEGPGAYVWTVIAALAGILSVVKPFLQLSKGIERYSKLYKAYSDLYFDLKRMVEDVKYTRSFSGEMKRTLNSSRDRHKALSGDDPCRDKKLENRCFDEVCAQIPVENLWTPPND